MKRSLLDWLLEKFPETPRKRAKQWIVAGRVRVEGKIVRRPNELLADPGASMELLGRNAVALDFDPAWQINARLSLLYMDSSLAAVNKAPGLLSVPAPDRESSALDLVADLLKGRLRPKEGQTLPAAFRNLKPLPVHRLDLYTSGVLCIALNPRARAKLIELFSAHTVTREYIAYVDGRPKTPRGTWRHWMQLSRDGLRQEIVSAQDAKSPRVTAVEAITHYEVMDEYPYHTKLRLRLETGRKHQIRVQAAQEGFPLVGDRVYNPRYHVEDRRIVAQRGPASPPVAKPRPVRHFVHFPRQALHAEVLGLEHPEQPGRRMIWKAELPADMRQLEIWLKRM